MSHTTQTELGSVVSLVAISREVHDGRGAKRY